MNFRIFVGWVLFLALWVPPALAEEMTMTTYFSTATSDFDRINFNRGAGGPGFRNFPNFDPITAPNGLQGGTLILQNRLGIGTENPQAALHVAGNAVFGTGDATATPGSIVIRGPSGAGTNIAGGSLTFNGGASTGTANGGELIFQTASPGAAGIGTNPLGERMRITAAGNVGIGTTSPAAALHVMGLGAASSSTPLANLMVESRTSDNLEFSQSQLLLNRARGTAASYTAVLNGDPLGIVGFGGASGTNVTRNNSAGIEAFAAGNWSGTSEPSHLTFFTTNPTNVNRQERMRITSDGRVGIGTTTPGQQLSVEGTAQANAALLNTSPINPDIPPAASLLGTIIYRAPENAFYVCLKNSSNVPSWQKFVQFLEEIVAIFSQASSISLSDDWKTLATVDVVPTKRGLYSVEWSLDVRSPSGDAIALFKVEMDNKKIDIMDDVDVTGTVQTIDSNNILEMDKLKGRTFRLKGKKSSGGSIQASKRELIVKLLLPM